MGSADCQPRMGIASPRLSSVEHPDIVNLSGYSNSNYMSPVVYARRRERVDLYISDL